MMGKRNQKKIFTSWPGLSLDLVHKHLTKEQSTILGHLQHPRKGLRPTQEKVMNSELDPEQDQFPQSTQSEKNNLVFFKTVDLSGKIYTDQTGRLPVTSSKGNKYIMVAYHYNSNTIHAEPLKTISGLDLTSAYQKLHSLLTNRGLRPHLHILDNECPNILNLYEGGDRKISVSTAPHPLEILSRTSNQDFQGALYRGTLQNSQGLPAPSLVLNYPTRHSHAHLTPTITHEPKTFRVCTTAWIIQLRRHASSPAWYKSHHP